MVSSTPFSSIGIIQSRHPGYMMTIVLATIPLSTASSLSVLRSSRMLLGCPSAIDLVIIFNTISNRFQNIVPISLYISIEFVRTCQAAFIYYDSEMVHKGQSTVARSWNLSDDLGQVEYIFSDKTGTLTQVIRLRSSQYLLDTDCVNFSFSTEFDGI